MKTQKKSHSTSKFDRTLLFRGGLFVVGAIILVQLFIVQIVKHEYYSMAALAEHVKKFEVSAERGKIYMTDGYSSVPVVLNEKKYLVYADPLYVQDTNQSAEQIQQLLGGDINNIKELLNSDSRYVVLAKKIDKSIADRIKEEKIRGIGLKEVSVRSYPQGQMASQVLGFVNDDGIGQYGFEEYFDKELTGKNGLQQKITDINGVPLAINNNQSQQDPVAGDDVTLSLDMRLQKIVEEKLQENVTRTSAKSGSAVLLDANTGKVAAMANVPTYDPSQYATQKDISIFLNTATNGAWEPGSVMKPFMMSAAFNEQKLNPNSTYFDKGYVNIADRTIKNSMEWGARTMSMNDIISKSLNTGAVYLLQSLGAGQVDDQARTIWYQYLTDRYGFGKPTNIELAGEQGGVVTRPDDNNGVTVRYANMSFGQGLTVTPLQLAAAYAALVNGGTYYQPSIVGSVTANNVEKVVPPKVVASNIISPQVSQDIRAVLKLSASQNNKPAMRNGYDIGAKSGTAEVAGDDGEYKTDAYNGAYIGFLSGKDKTYVLIVRLDEPKTSGFASAQAAIAWAAITNEILNTVPIAPM